MKRSRIGPGRKSLERGSTFINVKALLANNPRRRARTAPGARGWTQRVFALYGRQCVVCGGKASQAHHAVPRQTIVARGGDSFEIAYDPRNGVPVCFDCHQAHENASRRIPLSLLPPGVVAWADENGFRWYLDRTYPHTAVAS